MYEPVAPATPITATGPLMNTETHLQPPQPGFRDSLLDNRDSVNSDLLPGTPYRDDPSAAGSNAALYADKEAGMGYPPPPSPPTEDPSGKKKRPLWILILIGLAALVAIILAVILPVYFTVIRKDSTSSSASHTADPGLGGTSSAPTAKPTGKPTDTPSSKATTGGDGSTVTKEDGTTFVYKNAFGGYWVHDPKDPFNLGARAQSWSPALNETWRYGTDIMRGVNLGGWLVLEPFISPALYEPYANGSTPATDEWSLCENLLNDPSSGGLAKIEEHYKTFITEEDFAQIAAAGLNWVRLPIPYWAVEKFADEPFLEHVSWKYALKAFEWARKYGLRINLDLHAIPGSQNGYNHSGRGGTINFLTGAMGVANAQRALNHIRIITEFISQPQYKDVVPIFGVINEARSKDIGRTQITGFYLHMYEMMRGITGIGEGKGPYISVHDGFEPLADWEGFLKGGDRVAMDTHTYFCFGDQDTSPLASQLTRPCSSWGGEISTSLRNFGMTTSGEFSLAFNDCGWYLNGVNSGSRFDGTLVGYSGPKGPVGACAEWRDWTTWTQARKDELKEFTLNSMDALQHYYFWTWKVGESSFTGKVEAPLWAYKLGLDNGWIPKDPREAAGRCAAASPAVVLQPQMTGGPGSGEIAAAYKAQFPWPPPTISPGIALAALPTYTATGAIPVLPVPTFANVPKDLDGWTSEDKTPIFVPIAGCSYPPQWDATAVTPTSCSGVQGVIVPQVSSRTTGVLTTATATDTEGIATATTIRVLPTTTAVVAPPVVTTAVVAPPVTTGVTTVDD